MTSKKTGNHSVGTLKEKSLHAGIKRVLEKPGDKIEVNVEGFVIDILRGDRLIEIQTGSFHKMRHKLTCLLASGYQIDLVHPIPCRKWIVRLDGDGNQVGRRKSPKRGRIEEVFSHLMYIPDQVMHPNLTLRVLLTEQEEVWRDDGKGSWRRKYWSLYDQRLLAVVSEKVFNTRADYLSLFPAELPEAFTNKMLAEALACRRRVAQKMTYSSRKMGLIRENGRLGRSKLFEVVQP